MRLAEFVKKRNGVPIGHSASLQKNLYRALGAKNYSAFWSYWNPIFGYYLGTKIFEPLKKFFPIAFSLILTFVFCGLIHDFVTTIFRGKPSLFFSVWFLLMGVGVVLTKYFDYDLSKKQWIFRATTNLLIIGFCLLLTILLNTVFKFY